MRESRNLVLLFCHVPNLYTGQNVIPSEAKNPMAA